MNKIMNNVNIIMTPEELEKFKMFLQHYEIISVLLESNAFNQKSASVILNFDHLGTLQDVKREDTLYIKKFAKIK